MLPFESKMLPLESKMLPWGSKMLPWEHFAMHFAMPGAFCSPGSILLGAFCSLGSKMLCHSKMLIAKCSPGGAFCYREEQNAPMGAICSPGSILLWSKMFLSKAKCPLSRAKCSPWGAKCSQKDCRMTTTDSGARCALK